MKKNRVIEAIIDSGLIEPQNVVIAGVSGGPDSLCLLHALNSLSDAYDLIIIPVHVNHGLRPEAVDEAMHVADICDRMGLECQLFESDCREMADEFDMTLEEAGRIIRYQIFDDVAERVEEEGIPKDNIRIAVAHNADDQAETVLFRLIRGTGVHGLFGIPDFRYSEEEYAIVRPLLSVTRAEIEDYIRENRLKPNYDKSNKDNDCTRNKIRNELIPYLEKNYNPQIKESLRRYASLAGMDDFLLQDFAISACMDCMEVSEDGDTTWLKIDSLRENPLPVNRRIISQVMSSIGLESRITYENVTAVTELIYKEDPSAGIDLPFGLRAQRDYDMLVFSEAEDDLKPDLSIQILPQIIKASEFDPDDDAPYAAFDFDKFSEDYPGRIGEITLRTRQEGDYLPMKRGRKKIQDLFVDSKVKKSARSSILMACIDSEVLWILPNEHFQGEQERIKGRFTSKYHISDTTERVLLIELDDSI